MHITRVTPFLIDSGGSKSWLFVKLETDAGIVGWVVGASARRQLLAAPLGEAIAADSGCRHHAKVRHAVIVTHGEANSLLIAGNPLQVVNRVHHRTKAAGNLAAISILPNPLHVRAADSKHLLVRIGACETRIPRDLRVAHHRIELHILKVVFRRSVQGGVLPQRAYTHCDAQGVESIEEFEARVGSGVGGSGRDRGGTRRRRLLPDGRCAWRDRGDRWRGGTSVTNAAADRDEGRHRGDCEGAIFHVFRLF